MKLACMGGWCRIRDACPRYHLHSPFIDPAERLCPPGVDILDNDDEPIVRIIRRAGSWERLGPAMLRPAEPFDGLAA